jgi:hypothetical protein
MFVGCSYKPSSHYAKSAIEGNVYVDLHMNIDNTESSVYVKDAVNEMIINQFKALLVNDKSKADVLVTVALSSVSHTSLSTGDDGYSKTYRTSVNIKMTYQKVKGEIKTLSVGDYYDYSVDSNSILTDQKKKTAVKTASTKALSNLFSKIAVNSMRD